MTELLYPDSESGVRVLPAPSIDNPAPSVLPRGEYFPVVESSGLVVAKALRSYCHSGVKLLHPVVHLHVLDRMGRLYLQKRPETKDIQPGKWDTAVGGHVDYGEEIIDALYREAYEELGLEEFNPTHIISYVFESSVEKELVNVFAIVGEYAIRPSEEELEGGRFWEISEIEANMGKNVFTPNFESEFSEIKDKLLALL